MLSEQHRANLFANQIRIQQETMSFIGEEIHDNVGQKLTLASLYAKQLSYFKDVISDGVREQAIGKMIDESLSDLRQLSKSLTNPLTSVEGIEKLLQSEALVVNAVGRCTLKVYAEQAPFQMSLRTKNILYRLLQEFIQNSLKHSACTQIDIHLFKASESFHIEASDNGIGFDPSGQYDGIGLRTMHRRLNELHAAYELCSTPDNGTKLIITLPISSSEI